MRLQGLRRPLDAAVLFVPRNFSHPEAERHVPVDGHVRVKRVGLEHHGDVPVLGGDAVDDIVVDGDLAGGDVFQARDHAEQSRLSTSRRSDEHDQFLVRDLDVDAVDHLDGTEGLVDVFDFDAGHGPPLCPASGSIARALGDAAAAGRHRVVLGHRLGRQRIGRQRREIEACYVLRPDIMAPPVRGRLQGIALVEGGHGVARRLRRIVVDMAECAHGAHHGGLS